MFTVKHNFRSNRLGAQPIIMRRKLVVLPLNFQNNNPQLFFGYDEEIARARTIGIRLIDGGLINDIHVSINSNLVSTSTGIPIAAAFYDLVYLQVFFCGIETKDSHSDVLIQKPVVSFLGNNASGATATGATERVTIKVNKRIDLGKSFVQLISPVDVPSGTALVFAWDYEPINLAA
jgi:hypothetical protein